MNGNRLCGEEDVTYVVLALGSNDDSLFMKVFEGTDVPQEAVAHANPQVGTCSTYNFSRKEGRARNPYTERHRLFHDVDRRVGGCQNCRSLSI